jgi:hypothetical protein
MTSSVAVVESWHVHSSPSLAEQWGVASDQMQGVGYSESEVETNAVALEL